MHFTGYKVLPVTAQRYTFLFNNIVLPITLYVVSRRRSDDAPGAPSESGFRALLRSSTGTNRSRQTYQFKIIRFYCHHKSESTSVFGIKLIFSRGNLHERPTGRLRLQRWRQLYTIATDIRNARENI